MNKNKINYNPFKDFIEIQVEKPKQKIEPITKNFLVKYKPLKSKFILGNEDKIENLKFQLENNINNFFIICGPSGCGKSISIQLLLSELKYDFEEFNASSHMTRKDIINHILQTGLNKKFELSKKKILYKHAFIIEDFQHTLSLQSGVKLIIELLENINLCPIIFISSTGDYYHKDISKLCQTIHFNNPPHNQITRFIKNICRKEKIKINEYFIQKVLELCNSDIRKILNILYIISVKNKDKFNDNKYIDTVFSSFLYDNEISLKTSVNKLLKQDYTTIDDTLNYYYSDIGMCPLYVHENYIDYTDLDNIAKSIDNISSSDIVQVQLRNNQWWDLWDFIGILSCSKPSYYASISDNYTSNNFRCSSALNKNSLAINNSNRINKITQTSIPLSSIKDINTIFHIKNIFREHILNKNYEDIVKICKYYELDYNKFDIIYRNINIDKKKYKPLPIKIKNIIKKLFENDK